MRCRKCHKEYECNCEEKKSINCCIKCGSNDIEITNCGYSSFNAGSGECKNCNHNVEARNGDWDEDNWIIEAWNLKNPTKEVEIKKLEEQLEKLREKIEKAKQREW